MYVLRVMPFSLAPWHIIGLEKGFFSLEEIEPRFTVAPGSAAQLMSIASGRYHIAVTAVDNIIAWNAGQGADLRPRDFFIFMVLHAGLGQGHFYASKEIRGWRDLRGRRIAVDAYNSGFQPALYTALMRHGLKLEEDYEAVPVGGPSARFAYLEAGWADGAILSPPYDRKAQEMGFNYLGNVYEYVRQPVLLGAEVTTKAWARGNGDLIARYVKSCLSAFGWMADQENRVEAVDAISRSLGTSQQTAARIHENSLDPKTVLLKGSAIDARAVDNAVRNEMETRAQIGLLEAPHHRPEDLYDLQYMEKALASL